MSEESSFVAARRDGPVLNVGPSEFIPFEFHGATAEDLQMLFDGPAPKPGGAVELFCYEATDTTIKMKWRVITARCVFCGMEGHHSSNCPKRR